MNWLIKSSIGRKFVQSISGLFMILFLLFHVSMNLVLIFNYETYDFLANEVLGANWWAIVGTGVIALGFVVHTIYAIWLTLQNRKARGKDRYASSSKTDTTWSSQNMFVLGLFILLFLLLHLYQFWYEMQFKELLMIEGARHDSATLVKEVFSQVWVVIVYIAAFVALWFHLTHGFWSALHTVGWNNTIWMKRIKVLGNVVSTAICLGFIVVALAMHFGFSNLVG
ncbi:MAG: succinate dehydrogenase/fumarate reductase cytochrome b subunit [Proteiniphilum sp.]|jgi:succinate dehydrogenase / fumarate reductase cytochrome b subunit|nr:succinate dehydrogenase/fumarate reductase cytochrome b subunit [Proteiniphilum sp.]NCB26888.1 succinate dehydrogenase/fumarate reductase cytochrome b subunit [Bacteroidia bacterium]MDD2936929.1 succinate dehydrogenase/fumarate reductase cytochrome b subunit [Proteiniphilum sp.]MDD3076568.1 succinate dehydrogenase/fumarate reductase cytochrome b subunit [Proteiniphilum sp.]MDD3778605.1 succinate dehydrogenase/fumarate reductase cytochrome b subunit [Proteiniphilum sp.]